MLDGSACSRCGDTLDRAGYSSLCRACRLAPPPFTRAVAYGLYEGGMREAIHALKYSRLHPAAQVLGKMLAQAIARLAGEAPAEMLVVPVPLHSSKFAQRGFNQARALAEAALRDLKKTHPSWRLVLAPTTLLRLRSTESQAGLTPRQRRQNVRGAFSVGDAGQVTAKHILLVDDILTTGATARAAAQALSRAGAASVWVATLARARRQGAPDVEASGGDEYEDGAIGAGSETADFGFEFQPGLARRTWQDANDSNRSGFIHTDANDS